MFGGGIIVEIVVMIEEEDVVLVESGVMVEVVHAILVVVDGCGDSVVDGGEESCAESVDIV